MKTLAIIVVILFLLAGLVFCVQLLIEVTKEARRMDEILENARKRSEQIDQDNNR